MEWCSDGNTRNQCVSSEGSLVYTAQKWLLFLPIACSLQLPCGSNPPWSHHQSYIAQQDMDHRTYSACYILADVGTDALQL